MSTFPFPIRVPADVLEEPGEFTGNRPFNRKRVARGGFRPATALLRLLSSFCGARGRGRFLV